MICGFTEMDKVRFFLEGYFYTLNTKAKMKKSLTFQQETIGSSTVGHCLNVFILRLFNLGTFTVPLFWGGECKRCFK